MVHKMHTFMVSTGHNLSNFIVARPFHIPFVQQPAFFQIKGAAFQWWIFSHLKKQNPKNPNQNPTTWNILWSFMLRDIVNIKALSWQLAGCDKKLNKNIWMQNILSDIISFQYFLERFYEDKTNFCGQLYAFILSLTGYRIMQQNSFCLILPRPWQEQVYWLQIRSGAKNPFKWKQNTAPIYWVQWIINK